MLAELIKDLAWKQIHVTIHGSESDFRPIGDTISIINDLDERNKKGALNPLELSKPVLNAFNFFVKHKAFIYD